MSVVDGVADAEVTTVRGFRALSGLGRSPGVHLSSSRRWGQWVRGACRSCTFFLLTVCTLADSARCFSGHMANDNPVHSFFVVTVDTWAGVCCAVPADITHSRSILFHTVKGRTRPIFFKRLHSFIAPFFIYFYYTLTLQSSPPRYMWLTYPHPFARVWAPWHFCKKKKTRLPSSTSEMLDKMTLIPNPNAENTARSQLYGEKKIVFQYARDLCPPRPGTITQQIQPAEQGGCEEFRHSAT